MFIFLVFLGGLGVMVLFMVAGKMVSDDEIGKSLFFMLCGVFMLSALAIIMLITWESHVIKYVPNLKELYQDGKILEAEQKLEEMKLERLNIEN